MAVGSASASSRANQAKVSYSAILKSGSVLQIFQEGPVVDVVLGDEAFSCAIFILD